MFLSSQNKTTFVEGDRSLLPSLTNPPPLFFALLATDFPAVSPSTLPPPHPPLPAGHQSISAPGRHVCGEGLM